MTRFVPNANFERELRLSPAYKAAMKAEAERVADCIRMAAAGIRDGGHYERSIHVSSGRIAGDDPGTVIEFGSRNNPVHAPVRRGVRAAGLRFVGDDVGGSS